ncbi:MAG: LuxR C-terminal-related transcriptional regulator [Firmicutes bacterium]|nr:LuxR C-terminal-related transcriptional regulator [Bacillota bacterium]
MFEETSIAKERLSNEVLSTRELEVANLIIKGLTREQIAKQLVVSPFTIKNHVANILKKTNCKNQKDLIIKYC